ncbi:MAG: hypothetical protein JNJ54_08255 [Myxococcaceae bacterium]|nr:hypothetical protein [Myxococcaceae bacterium]
MTRRTTLLFLWLGLSCAGLRAKPDVDELKPSIEAFHQRARWKDFRGAAELIVPERRTSFIKARTRAGDEKDLFVTNFDLEDAKISSDGTAEVVSHINWYRLPSNVEKTATVTSVFVWREGKWWLESQDDGPFPELAPAPKKDEAPAADGGA